MSADLQYATTSNGQEVAYRVVEGGPGRPVFYVPGFLYSVESVFDDPPYARFVAGLAEASPVVLVDRRGIGASDPVDFDADPWQQWADDLIAVGDVLAIDELAVVGYGPSADLVLEAAARHPTRVGVVVAVHPIQMCAPDELLRMRDLATGVVRRDGDLADDAFRRIVPGRADEPGFLDWNLRAGRLGASPGVATRFWLEVLRERSHDHFVDISARTLFLVRRGVMERWDGQVRLESMVDAVDGAALSIVEGDDAIVNSGDVDELVFEIASFVHGSHLATPAARPVKAVLFTDIVASTEAARSAGDVDWRKVLDHHDRMIERTLARNGGRMVKATGDGALAVFDSPSRATTSARALQSELARLGIEVRMGLHVGEVEVRRSDIAGIAVHLAARVMGAAAPGQILTTAAVPLATLGSGHHYRGVGTREFKGFDGSFEIFEVAIEAAP